VLQENDLSPDEPPVRPLTAEENDRAAVWLEVEELRFLDEERLRSQSVKRILHYLERGNIALDDCSHLVHSLRVRPFSFLIFSRRGAGRFHGRGGVGIATSGVAVALQVASPTTAAGGLHQGVGTARYPLS
jgi:hypothetical protein